MTFILITLQSERNINSGYVHTAKKSYVYLLEEMPVWVKVGATIQVYPEKVSCTDEIDLKKAITIMFYETFKGLNASVIGKLVNS
jgi:hypothetical protein